VTKRSTNVDMLRHSLTPEMRLCLLGIQTTCEHFLGHSQMALGLPLAVAPVAQPAMFLDAETNFMKWFPSILLILAICALYVTKAPAQSNSPAAGSKPQSSIIVGTVTDQNNDTVSGANIALEGRTLGQPLTTTSNGNGFFQFEKLEAGTYLVTIQAQGFATWKSPALTLYPGQYMIVKGSELHIKQTLTTLDVVSTVASSEEIAKEQLKTEERQRILGLIPNFLVTYDGNAEPLTPKLKFKLASKVIFDPVTIVGVAAFAGINQAGNTPNYPQGAKGYGERFGAAYADGFTDIMVGGALLPSLLHQDPRYFYQGTGTTESRLRHALLSPFICKGDDGRRQPNYSTVGGDLTSAALANVYYPVSNRGLGLFLGNFFINTGQRALANVAQEFILRRVTSRPGSSK
jgi:hypothetical protein